MGCDDFREEDFLLDEDWELIRKDREERENIAYNSLLSLWSLLEQGERD